MKGFFLPPLITPAVPFQVYVQSNGEERKIEERESMRKKDRREREGEKIDPVFFSNQSNPFIERNEMIHLTTSSLKSSPCRKYFSSLSFLLLSLLWFTLIHPSKSFADKNCFT